MHKLYFTSFHFLPIVVLVRNPWKLVTGTCSTFTHGRLPFADNRVSVNLTLTRDGGRLTPLVQTNLFKSWSILTVFILKSLRATFRMAFIARGVFLWFTLLFTTKKHKIYINDCIQWMKCIPVAYMSSDMNGSFNWSNPTLLSLDS